MKDLAASFTYELEDLKRADWIEDVKTIAEDFGHAMPVGLHHNSYLIDMGSSLLVSFESVGGIRKQNKGSAPVGWPFVRKHGWSSLTLMSDFEADWFRHPSLFHYFDRLIDDGFFDDFDRILFYGAGSAAYAAAAFSVAAPDCEVLLIQPQATLARDKTRWDKRFPEARRLDFNSRYGYAPDMIETANQVWVLHDPNVIEDAMHAQLFDGANTTHLTCPYIGPTADIALGSMGVLSKLIEQAMNGTLSPQSFAQLWRARHGHLPYARTLFHRLEMHGEHPRLLARLCRNMSEGGKRKMFAKKLEELEAQGISL